MKYLWPLLLVGAPAAACVQGSYRAVADRLRVCEVNNDGRSAYADDPSNVKLMDFLKRSRADQAMITDFTALSGMTPEMANAFFDKETNSGHYRAKLTADAKELTPVLERFATKMNEYYGYDGAVAYLESREKAERVRKPLGNPLSDLDRFAAWNRPTLASLTAPCAENPKSPGDLRAVEMVYPADGHRQTIVPIALTYADGAKNHGKLFFIGREGVTSRDVARRNGKIYVTDAKKKEFEVMLNQAPAAATTLNKRDAKDPRGDACVIAALGRRGDVAEATAASPAPYVKPAKGAKAGAAR